MQEIDLFEAIYTQRQTTHYKNDPVSMELIHKVIEAATKASERRQLPDVGLHRHHRPGSHNPYQPGHQGSSDSSRPGRPPARGGPRLQERPVPPAPYERGPGHDPHLRRPQPGLPALTPPASPSSGASTTPPSGWRPRTSFWRPGPTALGHGLPWAIFSRSSRSGRCWEFRTTWSRRASRPLATPGAVSAPPTAARQRKSPTTTDGVPRADRPAPCGAHRTAFARPARPSLKKEVPWQRSVCSRPYTASRQPTRYKTDPVAERGHRQAGLKRQPRPPAAPTARCGTSSRLPTGTYWNRIGNIYREEWLKAGGEEPRPGQPDVYKHARYLARHMPEVPAMILVCADHSRGYEPYTPGEPIVRGQVRLIHLAGGPEHCSWRPGPTAWVPASLWPTYEGSRRSRTCWKFRTTWKS